MNESSVSSAFQTKLRQALPGAVLVKLADKSLIGLVDAFVTHNKKTLFMEYKFIGPATKGVKAGFMNRGEWSPLDVASASPTQFDMAHRLAEAGNCIYLFWVLDPSALRKRVAYVTFWHPITGQQLNVEPDAVVSYILGFMQNNTNELTSLFSNSNQQQVTT